MGGSAGDAAVRQGGDARVELDPVRIEAERLGGDLGEGRPGALPHVGAGGLHQRGSVGAQGGARLGREVRAVEDGRAHAPAD